MQTTLPATLNVGTVKAHHMPEDYYAKWQRLYNRAKRVNTRKARVALAEHENKHNTN